MKKLITMLLALALTPLLLNAQPLIQESNPTIPHKGNVVNRKAPLRTPSIDAGDGRVWWKNYDPDENASWYIYGTGNAEHYNAAIYIPYGMVGGSHATVEGVSILPISTEMENVKVWVSTKLPAFGEDADLETVDVNISELDFNINFNDVAFDNAYEIPESGLYVGYSFDITGTEATYSTQPLVYTSTSLNRDGAFYYNTTNNPEWNKHSGNLLFNVLIGGEFLMNAATAKDFPAAYVLRGEQATVPVEVTNMGVEPITSLAYNVMTDGSETDAGTVIVSPIEYQETAIVNFPVHADKEARAYMKTITITNVNDEENESNEGVSATGKVITLLNKPDVVPVVEEFTGTWCGWCPRGIVGMSNMHDRYGDRVSLIAVHKGDVMEITDYDIYVGSYPSAHVDRNIVIDPNTEELTEAIETSMNRIVPGEISVKAKWGGKQQMTIQIETETTFQYDESEGNYGIAYVLVEDGLTGTGSSWAQSNYYSGYSGTGEMSWWYQQPSKVTGIEYNHVPVGAWYIQNGLTGTIPKVFEAGDPLEFSFTADIREKSLIQDKSKLKVIVLLIDKSSNTIVNSAQAEIEENPYENDDIRYAQAIWCEGSHTLYFINSDNDYAVGDTWNGESITALWTKSEVTRESSSLYTIPAWIDVAGKTMQKVVFDKSFANVKPVLLSYWFYKCEQLKEIEGLPLLNTSLVTNMYCMFYNCSSLTSLDVSHFDTSNVTDMYYMFYNCSGLTSLDVSHFDTSNVTDMYCMFYGCSGLTSLDVSDFDTSKVTDMGYMFSGCSGLTSLDVSHFDTSNVTKMYSMFYGCSGLTSLDVSGFDTSKVMDMGSMFSGCSGLTSLDVSGFDTSKVTDMGDIFSVCSGLTSLDVSGFDTSKVTDMGSMFFGCSGLTNLNLSHFDTSKVINMNYMFFDCTKLTTIYCNDTWTAEKSNNMFALCNNLTGGKGFKYNYEYVTVEYANPDEKGYFTAINNPDAMDDLEIENANSQAIIYDLQGRRVGHMNGTGIKPFMPEGIYIIRYDNGSTRKVKR